MKGSAQSMTAGPPKELLKKFGENIKFIAYFFNNYIFFINFFVILIFFSNSNLKTDYFLVLKSFFE